MTVDIFSSVLSYATIPLYVGGLLLLIYFIAHFQTGFSLSEEAKQVVKAKLIEVRPKAPISTYLVVAALFALFMLLAITNQRRQRL